ncbi:MAG: hypothetical protein JRF63_11150 [Deltaproteobacteria bacterium]|nr:hypothetical protein [Deltaproteobacteria bacterium]
MNARRFGALSCSAIAVFAVACGASTPAQPSVTSPLVQPDASPTDLDANVSDHDAGAVDADAGSSEFDSGVNDADAGPAALEPAVTLEPLGEQEAIALLREKLKQAGVLIDDTREKTRLDGRVLEMRIARGKKVFARAGLDLDTHELTILERPYAAKFRARLPKPLEKLRVGRGAHRTSDGISVRIASEGHAHRVGGGAAAIFEFIISKGGKKQHVSLMSEIVYAEARAFDRVFVFKEDPEGRIFARVYSDRGSIGMDRAGEITDRLVTKLGLVPDQSSLGNGPTGAYEFTYHAGKRVLCSGLVGAYTGQVVQFELVDSIIRDDDWIQLQ